MVIDDIKCKKTWKDADAHCKDLGGELGIPSSTNINIWVSHIKAIMGGGKSCLLISGKLEGFS